MPRIFASKTSFRLRPNRVVTFSRCSLGLGDDIDLGFDAKPKVYAHVLAGRSQDENFRSIANVLEHKPTDNFGSFRIDYRSNYFEVHFLLPGEDFNQFWRDVVDLYPHNLEVEIGFSVSDLVESFKRAKVGLIDDEFSISAYSGEENQ